MPLDPSMIQAISEALAGATPPAEIEMFGLTVLRTAAGWTINALTYPTLQTAQEAIEAIVQGQPQPDPPAESVRTPLTLRTLLTQVGEGSEDLDIPIVISNFNFEATAYVVHVGDGQYINSQGETVAGRVLTLQVS